MSGGRAEVPTTYGTLLNFVEPRAETGLVPSVGTNLAPQKHAFDR